MNSQDYNFKLPRSLIASEPSEPRNSSRLFIYSTKTDEILIDVFSNISRYLPQNSLIVFNNKKVGSSSIELSRIIGGKVKVSFLLDEWKTNQIIKGKVDKIINDHEIFFLDHEKFIQVESQANGEIVFRILISIDKFLRSLDKRGHTSLPSGINSSMTEETTHSKYQTIFASQGSLITNSTASLHFTQNTLRSLEMIGIDKAFITLHAGRDNKLELYNEPISISKESSEKISKAKSEGKHIVAVGSTAIRLLESTADYILKGEAYDGETSILIKPPFSFKVADILITNFHLPNSRLLLLVDAFLEDKKSKRKVKDLYEIAIKDKFRFHSFGDAMLIV